MASWVLPHASLEGFCISRRRAHPHSILHLRELLAKLTLLSVDSQKWPRLLWPHLPGGNRSTGKGTSRRSAEADWPGSLTVASISVGKF
jgi:hypothetical protein